MSFFPGNDPQPGDAFASDQIELLVIPNSRDIGGFSVRRALPTAKRRLVGPFIFFDRMGPAILRADQAMDVRPHPHIGLSTVTYLFDGKIRHRDSLGTEMVIEPGDVNLMTAGQGHRSLRALTGRTARPSAVDFRLADLAGAAGPQGRDRAGVRKHRQAGAARVYPPSGVKGPAHHRRAGGHALAGHRLSRHALRRYPPGRRRFVPHSARRRRTRDLHAGRRRRDLRRHFPGRPPAGVPARRRDRR